MSAIPIKLRFGRFLSQSGSAGTRRLMIVGGFVLVIVLGSVMMMTSQRHSETGTAIAKVPVLDPLPGGPHTSPAYSELATRADQNRAAVAVAAQRSSVATMPGRETAVANVDVPTTVAETPRPAPTLTPATSETLSRPNPPAPRAGTQTPPVTTPSNTSATSAQTTATTAAAANAKRQADDEKAKVYQAAISSLLAGWGDKAQATEVVLVPDERSGSGENRSGSIGAAQGRQPLTLSNPVPNARRLADRGSSSASRQVLMPAGRGVYGRTVLAASSDQGGPVVIEALSGPVVGDRMTGTFETRDTRMVVRLTSITLQDGTQQKINALVIAPDTLETSVASSVDQHYVTRFVLPVAAAFVSGLGQALAQSNSTVVAGPLGGATAFQRLNLPQQLGVAAGAAANQFGSAVTANAPKGPTVNLEANVNVGIMFLEPVYSDAEP